MNEKALADLRHDLRTPIGLVLGYGEMVADELADAGRTDLLADVEKIRAAGRRLLAMVDERLQAEALGGLEKPEAPPAVITLRPAESGSPEAPSEEGGLLLIVYYNEDNRDVLARRLKKQGHRAVTAGGGQEALAALG